MYKSSLNVQNCKRELFKEATKCKCHDDMEDLVKGIERICNGKTKDKKCENR